MCRREIITVAQCQRAPIAPFANHRGRRLQVLVLAGCALVGRGFVLDKCGRNEDIQYIEDAFEFLPNVEREVGSCVARNGNRVLLRDTGAGADR